MTQIERIFADLAYRLSAEAGRSDSDSSATNGGIVSREAE
jgi:hypothetical protein